MEMIFELDDKISIMQAEEKTLALYTPILNMYACWFKQYDANLRISIEREFQPAYRAFIVCKVTDHAGNIVESRDHDMFMDFAWVLSYTNNNRIFVVVDIDSDAIPLLESCEEYFRHPY